jgi:hypothetical protein
VLDDGSIVAPFGASGYYDSGGQLAPLTLYAWKPGATSWSPLAHFPSSDVPTSYLVTRASSGGKTTLWVVFRHDGEQSPPTPSGAAQAGSVVDAYYWVARYQAP